MFIDIHAHAYRRPVVGVEGVPVFSTPEQLLARHEEIGIEKAVLLPLIGPEVYLPQSNEEIIQMAADFPGRFVPFCNVDPRAMSNSADARLGNLLRYYKERGCKGIGEVMPNMPFLHPMVQNLFKHVEEVGFPLIFDISTRIGGTYGLYDDAGLPQLETCLQRFPRLKILAHGPAFWAEIGQLERPEDRAGYPPYPVKEEGVVPRLMRRYANLHGDLSAGSGHNALARDGEYAARFLNEFHERLYFGTDICAPDQPAPQAGLLIGFRDAGKIGEEVFRNIARENAVRLLES